MTKHALLFGSSYDGLEYAYNSVVCLELFLRDSLGFSTRHLIDDANRENILAELEELSHRIAADDVVVIYFCGHSGTETNPDWNPDDPDTVSRQLLYLVPVDYNPNATTFRGVLSWELSLRVEALTRVCPNVTAILDCCSAADILERLPGPSRSPLQALFDSLRDDIQGFRSRRPLGNADLIKVTGSGGDSQAFQADLPTKPELERLGIALTPKGDTIGALTIGLIRLLAPIVHDGTIDSMSWRGLRPGLEGQVPAQTPEIIGPTDRVPFSLTTLAGIRANVQINRDGAILSRGSVAGVSIGDVYGLVDAGGPDEVLAQLTVRSVQPHLAVGSVRSVSSTIAQSLAAIPLTTAFARYPVVVETSASEIDELLARSFLVRASGSDATARLATVRAREGVVEIATADEGVAVTSSLADAANLLESLASVRRLRALENTTGWTTNLDVSCQLVRYRAGSFTIVDEPRPAFQTDDRLAVRLENLIELGTGVQDDRYVNLLYIDPLGRITILNEATQGERVDAADVAQIPEPGDLAGFALSWPEGMDPSRARAAFLAIIVSTEGVDLRDLANGSLPVSARETTSGAGRKIEHRRSSAEHALMPPNSFHIQWIELQLAPQQAALESARSPVVHDGATARILTSVQVVIDVEQVVADRVDE